MVSIYPYVLDEHKMERYGESTQSMSIMADMIGEEKSPYMHIEAQKFLHGSCGGIVCNLG